MGPESAAGATPPEDERDIAWAEAQGQGDRKAGSPCADYKAFLAKYDLVHTRYTLRMWEAYRKAQRTGRAKRKQVESGKARPRLTREEWDAKSMPVRSCGR